MLDRLRIDHDNATATAIHDRGRVHLDPRSRLHSRLPLNDRRRRQRRLPDEAAQGQLAASRRGRDLRPLAFT